MEPLGGSVLGLITDYGYKDVYAGILKIVAKNVCPKSEVIDVTHGIRPFDILEGAVATLVTVPHMKENDVLVVVVDPGVGSEREAIAARIGNRYLVAPNNGVLWLAAKEYGVSKVVKIEKKLVPFESYTFHGRDIFAPAGAFLDCRGSLEELGEETELKPLNITLVREVGEKIRTNVIYIDNFGNIMTWAKELPFDIGQKVKVNGKEAKVVRTFSEVKPRELAVYINSFGYVEIAQYMGSAAKALRVKPGVLVVIE